MRYDKSWAVDELSFTCEERLLIDIKKGIMLYFPRSDALGMKRFHNLYKRGEMCTT